MNRDSEEFFNANVLAARFKWLTPGLWNVSEKGISLRLKQRYLLRPQAMIIHKKGLWFMLF